MIMSYIGNMKKTENTMSKIVRAIEIMKANPALAKKEMVELFMTELAMNKANANGYFVSATKKLGNPKTAAVRVKKAPTEKQTAVIKLAAEKEAKKAALYEEKMTAALKKLETKQALAEAKRQEKAAKAKPASNKKAKAEAVAPVEEAVAEKVTVSRITINDIKYLKSSTNILYNPETREEVGLYDPETKTIKALPDDEEEEMTEDTYESDNE